MNQPDRTLGVPPRPAKPYTTPTLTIFGELALLTKGTSKGGLDTNGLFGASSSAPGPH
jgi:hypothetical protein